MYTAPTHAQCIFKSSWDKKKKKESDRRAESTGLLMWYVLKPLIALILHQANANGQAWMVNTRAQRGHISLKHSQHKERVLFQVEAQRRAFMLSSELDRLLCSDEQKKTGIRLNRRRRKGKKLGRNECELDFYHQGFPLTQVCSSF